MGYSVSWDNPAKTVLLQEYIDPVRKDDFYQLVQVTASYLSTHVHTIHLILDERRVNFALTATDLDYVAKLLPPNQGAVVVITQYGLLSCKQITLELITQTVTRQGTYFVESLKAARQVLQEHYGVYSATTTA